MVGGGGPSPLKRIRLASNSHAGNSRPDRLRLALRDTLQLSHSREDRKPPRIEVPRAIYDDTFDYPLHRLKAHWDHGILRLLAASLESAFRVWRLLQATLRACRPADRRIQRAPRIDDTFKIFGEKNPKRVVSGARLGFSVRIAMRGHAPPATTEHVVAENSIALCIYGYTASRG